MADETFSATYCVVPPLLEGVSEALPEEPEVPSSGEALPEVPPDMPPPDVPASGDVDPPEAPASGEGVSPDVPPAGGVALPEVPASGDVVEPPAPGAALSEGGDEVAGSELVAPGAELDEAGSLAGSELVAPVGGGLPAAPLVVSAGGEPIVLPAPLVAVSPPPASAPVPPWSHAAKVSDASSAASNTECFILRSLSKVSL